MTLAAPDLSVVIASHNTQDTIVSCLESLSRQKADRPFEIIVVDSSTDGTAGIVAERFPGVQIFSFQQRKYCGEARNFGVSVARAEVVAFIDADCVADEHWVEEILKSHEDQALAIGGSIGNGNPRSFVGWAAYFCEFSAWMPDGPSGQRDDIAAANMSYKKEAFRRYGRFIEGTYCSDTQFHWRLAKAGHRLRFEPSIRIFHKNISRPLKFLIHEFMHGRSFGRVRAIYTDLSVLRRGAYVLLSFLIPVKLFMAALWNNINSRAHLFEFFVASPLVFLGFIFWSAGEVAGCIKPYE